MVDLPTRDGLRLCSHVNPQGEAQIWADSILGASAGQWIVLGVGAGFHLRALTLRFPEDEFLFLDFDANVELRAPIGDRKKIIILEPLFESGQVFNQVILNCLKTGFRVISFKPSWSGLETNFRRIESLLLGHQGECNPLLSADAGLKKAFFSVPATLEINIKSITETDQTNPSIRWRRLRALRELVT